jgi:hypothetical protein
VSEPECGLLPEWRSPRLRPELNPLSRSADYRGRYYDNEQDDQNDPKSRLPGLSKARLEIHPKDASDCADGSEHETQKREAANENIGRLRDSCCEEIEGTLDKLTSVFDGVDDSLKAMLERLEVCRRVRLGDQFKIRSGQPIEDLTLWTEISSQSRHKAATGYDLLQQLLVDRPARKHPDIQIIDEGLKLLQAAEILC